ncbi:MAG: hypothetical protein RLZZ144_1023 [Pseudomonadota bacterium]|jgi:outer membrane lipoprotein LolB
MKAGFNYALLIFLLSACSTPLTIKSTTHQALSFNGRVAIKHQAERSNVGINWVHGEHADDIVLLAPLGQTVGKIHLSPQQVTLDYGGKQYQAADAEALTEKVLGWNFPLAGLRYWIQAESAIGSEATIERNTSGQISLLQQDGWEIRYVKYASNRHDALPKKLALSRDDVELIILIDEWLQP